MISQNVLSPVCVLMMAIFLTLLVFYIIVMIVDHKRLTLVYNKEMVLNLQKQEKNSLSSNGKINFMKRKVSLRCNCIGIFIDCHIHLLKMYIIQMQEMSEHNFMQYGITVNRREQKQICSQVAFYLCVILCRNICASIKLNCKHCIGCTNKWLCIQLLHIMFVQKLIVTN